MMKKILIYTIIGFSVIGCSKLEIVRVDAKIDSITPDAAVPGSTVIITGANFTENTVVTFGTTEADVDITSDNQISVEVPTSLSTGEIEINITSRGIPAVVDFEVLPFFVEKTIHPGFREDGYPTGFVIDNRIYVGTGESTSDTDLNDFYVYSTESDSWGELKSENALPFRSRSKGFTANGKGYLIHSGFWEFDPNTRLWTELAPVPVNSNVPLVIGNNVYLVQDDYSQSTVWRYSIIDNTWTQMNDFPGGIRDRAVGFVIDGQAYFGQGEDLSTSQIFNDMWRYNESSDTWTEVSGPSPTAGLIHAAGFALNGKGYIGLGRSVGNTKTTFYQYTPETDNWKVIADLSSDPRVEPLAFIANRKVYLMYGSEVGKNGGERIDEVWEFTPESF